MTFDEHGFCGRCQESAGFCRCPPPVQGAYAVNAVNAVASVSAGQTPRKSGVDPYAVSTPLVGSTSAPPINGVLTAYAETPLNRPLTCADGSSGVNGVNGVTPLWPELHPDARQGLAGLVVDNLEPYTEADPAAILATFLSAAGVLFHRGAHVWAGDVEHPTRIWSLIIGATSGGMKGTSWAAVRRVVDAAAPSFLANQLDGGLISGEGLIERVRDAGDDDEPGVEDKRLLVVETEFAAVLARCRREGSTLGTTLRQAWDGTPLRTMARKHNRLRSSGHHVTVIGHIAPRELSLVLAEGDLVGGTINRLLPILSRRSRRLPDGGGAPDDLVDELGQQLANAVGKSHGLGRVARTPAAAELWRGRLYAELTPDDVPDGAVAHVVARAVPQVLRLSLTYALLDCRDEIDVEHLEAAMALWRYSTATARAVFGDASGSVNPNLDRLTAALRAAGPDGLSRLEIHRGVFSKNLTSRQLDALLSDLRDDDRLDETTRKAAGGKGRPSAHYVLRQENES